jgi:TFIIF-interacting CTD phosphatase-like protein
MKSGKLEHIILDLDETLIASKIDEKTERITKIIPRPHLGQFLNFLFKEFKSVSIWSAGRKEYVHTVLSKISKDKNFRFVYTQDECDFKSVFPKGGIYNSRHTDYKILTLKKLIKVFKKYKDMSKFNTIIIDDKDETFQENPDNAIHINGFDGSKSDTCLLKVAEKLNEIKTKKLDFLHWENREIMWNIKSKFKF